MIETIWYIVQYQKIEESTSHLRHILVLLGCMLFSRLTTPSQRYEFSSIQSIELLITTRRLLQIVSSGMSLEFAVFLNSTELAWQIRTGIWCYMVVEVMGGMIPRYLCGGQQRRPSRYHIAAISHRSRVSTPNSAGGVKYVRCKYCLFFVSIRSLNKY